MDKIDLNKTPSSFSTNDRITESRNSSTENVPYLSIPNVFYISGAQIPLAEIQNYQIIQREYIFRPSYKEKGNALKRIFSQSKFEFSEMIPYAAILTEAEYKAINKRSLFVGDLAKNAVDIVNTIASGINPGDLVANIAQGAVNGILDKIGSAVGSKKYYCVFSSGRTEEISLESIPPLLVRIDGKVFEPSKKEAKSLIPNENTKPIISTIPALFIKGKVDYLFYGNGINVIDVQDAYQQLCLVRPFM